MSNAANLNPETFLEGGGLIDDVDVTVLEARFESFDYNGKAEEPIPALKLKVQAADTEVEQYYSMGAMKDWIPSEDGKQLLAVGSATAIRLSSNGGIFLKALVDAGFPADKLGDDISILEGMQCHMIQVPEPERSMKKTEAQLEREKKFGPKTILVVSEVQTLPWEKKKPAGKPGGKKVAGKKKAAKKEENNIDIETKATDVINTLLAEAGTLTRLELPAKIVAAMKDDADRIEIVKMVFDPSEEFLKNGPWTYDEGTLIAG